MLDFRRTVLRDEPHSATPIQAWFPAVSGVVMKMVVALGQVGEIDDTALRRLALAIRNLISDNHKLTVIPELGYEGATGQTSTLRQNSYSKSGGTQRPQSNPHYWSDAGDYTLTLALRAAGVVAFTLSGLDGQILALRKCRKLAQPATDNAEVNSVSPYWLDVLTERGAVPILLNVGVDCDGRRCALDLLQLATECAIGWNADALIVVDQDESVRGYTGSVARWLEISQCEARPLSHSERDKTPEKIQACGAALRAGVRRIRILPLSEIGRLEDFFSSRIDAGTDLVL